MNENDEFVIIWEAPKIEPPEFRLYYDDQGRVVCYSGDKSGQGNYIVIDAQTFAEARPDVRVVEGKITIPQITQVVYKLMPAIEGISCHPEDMSIIVNENEDNIKWKLVNYEL